MYILLIAFMLLCMISKNNKLSMLGIFFISIASVVRYEAIILVIPFTISYFLKNKFSLGKAATLINENFPNFSSISVIL